MTLNSFCIMFKFKSCFINVILSFVALFLILSVLFVIYSIFVVS